LRLFNHEVVEKVLIGIGVFPVQGKTSRVERVGDAGVLCNRAQSPLEANWNDVCRLEDVHKR
jgi:hypothetical protein